MSNDRQYSGEEPADDVMQDATPDAPVVVPVRLDEPANVRELPKLGGGAWTEPALSTSGQRVLAADPKRAVATLIALDQAIYVGMDQGNVNAAAGTPNGARWPSGVPLVITHCDEVWVSSVTSTTMLSVLVERWAR